MSETIAKALSKAPADRFPSVQNFHAAFASAAGGRPLPSGRRTSWREQGIWVGGGLTTLLGLVWGVSLLVRGEPATVFPGPSPQPDPPEVERSSMVPPRATSESAPLSVGPATPVTEDERAAHRTVPASTPPRRRHKATPPVSSTPPVPPAPAAPARPVRDAGESPDLQLIPSL